MVVLITLGKAGAVYAGRKFGVIHEFFVDPVIRSNGVRKQLLDEVKNFVVKNFIRKSLK